MKKRDFFAEELSDVKNVGADEVYYPGQYVPFDMALFYPGGFIP